MNLVQSPDTLSLAANLKEIIISSSAAVKITLNCGSSVLLSESYTPDNSGNISINLADIVLADLTFDLPSTDLYKQTNIAKSYIVKADDTQICSFTAVGGGVNVENFSSASTFLAANFLTWQPQSKVVTPNQLEYLTYYFAEAGKFVVKYYATDGTSSTVNITVTTAGCYTLNTQYSRLIALADQTKEYYGYVDIWVEIDSEVASYVQRYIARNATDYDIIYLAHNSLGAIDTFCFSGERSTDVDIEHAYSSIEAALSANDTIAEKNITQNSGSLSEAELLWMLEFINSDNRYVVQDGELKQIVVTTSSVENSSTNTISSYNFTYKVSGDSKYLNITRKALPQNLTIVSPTEELFFLAPRLSEYLEADVDGEYYIPVQPIAGQVWHKLTLAALISKMVQLSNTWAHSHSNFSILEKFSLDTSTGKLLYDGAELGSGSGEADTELSNRIAFFENLFGTDDDGNVYVKNSKGFYSNSFISARGSDSTATGGGLDASTMWTALVTPTTDLTAQQIDISHLHAALANYVVTTDSRLSDSRVASDVYAWAKASTKPSYTASEVGALESTDTRIAQWVTAYGWGDHAAAGYLTTTVATSTYATINNLSAEITNRQSADTELANRIAFFENLFGTDTDGNVYVKNSKGFYSNSFISARGADSTATGGGLDASTMWTALDTPTTDLTAQQIDISHLHASLANYVVTTDSRLSDSRVASDVYAWAKASTKPSYSYTEITDKPTYYSANVLTATDDRDVLPNTTETASISAIKPFFISKISGSGTSNYSDFLVLDTWINTGGGNVNALEFNKGDYNIYHYQAAQTASSWGTGYKLWTEYNFTPSDYLTTSVASTTYATLTSLASANTNISTLQGYFTSGVANSATKLATARIIWGQSFNGTAAISGNLSSVGSITSAVGHVINPSNSGQISFQLNGSDTAAVILQIAAFKPYTAASGLLNLGESSARWATIYGNSLSLAGSISGVTSLSMSGGLSGVTTITTSGNITCGGQLELTGTSTPHIYTTNSYFNIGIGGASSKYTLAATYFRSVTDNYTTLGTSSYRWSTIYGTALNLNGAISGATTISASGDLTAASATINGQTVTSTKIALWDKISALFDVDDDGNVYVKNSKGFYSNSFISARGSDSTATGGGLDASTMWTALDTPTTDLTAQQIDISHLHVALANYVLTTDSRLSDSRVASDVYAWAKASTKPSYTYTEIGSLESVLLTKLDTSAISSWALASTKPTYSYSELTSVPTSFQPMVTYIGAYVDLNDYTTVGFYYCSANANATTLSNCPTSRAFSLLVERHAGYKQTLTEYIADGTARTWFRNYYSGTWGSWTLIYTANSFAISDYLTTSVASSTYLPLSTYTAADILNKLKTVDGSGSGLDADTLDGVHYSTISSDISTLQGYFTSGVANSATKLATARTIWGQSFDGTAAISGNLSSVGSITSAVGHVINPSNSGQISFQLNGSDTAAVILQIAAFKPYTAASGLLNLGESSARWATIYGNSLSLAGAISGVTTLATSGNITCGGQLGLTGTSTPHIYTTNSIFNIGIGGASSKYTLAATYFRSVTDNYTTLGTSSYRWSTVYATALNLNGAITGATTISASGAITSDSTLTARSYMFLYDSVETYRLTFAQVDTQAAIYSYSSTESTFYNMIFGCSAALVSSANYYGALFYNATSKNWGIGTSSPTERLHVYGSVKVNEALTAASATISGAVTANSLVVPYTGGTYIAAATSDNQLRGSIVNSATSAHSLFKITTNSGNVVAFTGYQDSVRFVGFSAANIASSTNALSFYTSWDSSTGLLLHNKAMTVSGLLTASSGITSTTGTFSSTLSANVINITSTSFESHLTFSKGTGTNFITAPTGGYIGFITEGKSVATANLDLHITSTGIGVKKYSPTCALDVTGAAAISSSLTVGGTISATGTIYSATGVYSSGYITAQYSSSSSDQRLKTNIKPLDSALTYIIGTKYISHRWKRDNQEDLGIIAQVELSREYSVLVKKHGEYYSYDYAKHGILVGKALQEFYKGWKAKEQKQDDEIHKLKNEVKKLKNRLYGCN